MRRPSEAHKVHEHPTDDSVQWFIASGDRPKSNASLVHQSHITKKDVIKKIKRIIVNKM